MNSGAHEVQKKVLDLLKLEVPKGVSRLPWVLELNLEEQCRLLNTEPSCPPLLF